MNPLLSKNTLLSAPGPIGSGVFCGSERHTALHNRLRIGQAEYPITWGSMLPPGRDAPRDWGSTDEP